MVGHGPEKYYVDPGSDLEIRWAQGIFTTLTFFSNCVIYLLILGKKISNRKSNEKNGLEYWENILAIQ